MKDYHFNLVKFQDGFACHSHDDTDEVFITLDGKTSIESRDGRAELTAGEMFVVYRGVEHKPFVESKCNIMLVEPAGKVNTGHAGGDLRAEDSVWI